MIFRIIHILSSSNHTKTQNFFYYWYTWIYCFIHGYLLLFISNADRFSLKNGIGHLVLIPNNCFLSHLLLAWNLFVFRIFWWFVLKLQWSSIWKTIFQDHIFLICVSSVFISTFSFTHVFSLNLMTLCTFSILI